MRRNALIAAGTLCLSTLFPTAALSSNADAGSRGPAMQNEPVLYTVHFAFGDDTVRPADRRALDTVAREIREATSTSSLRVVGYTDDIGPQHYNDDLALRRAEAVRRALVEAGIDSAAITIDAQAKREYVASNETREGRAHNRRAEVRGRTYRAAVPNGGQAASRTRPTSAALPSGEVRVGRYSTLAAVPTEAQADPLAAIVRVTLPSDVRTIGDALRHLLARSGWDLAEAAATDPAALALFALLLPETQRTLGPLPLLEALRVVCGSSFTLVLDPVHRLMSCELTPAFAHWQGNALEGP